MRAERRAWAERPKAVDADRRASEHTHDNVYWRGAAPRISICVPAYRYDVSPLINTLAACNAAGLTELIIHDDGSADHDMLARMEACAGEALLAVRIISADTNRGRSAARNAAMHHARADWILLLDADMIPDDPAFIERYLDAIDAAPGPALVVGGYSLEKTQHTRASALHRWQAETSECLPADQRSASPGQYAFSSNVLLHRFVLESAPFDEGFSGWGWEDTDWGLRAQRWFPVLHIDNTATHLGLDTDTTLMGKYARSGANFARLTKRHPIEAAQMPLYRTAMRFRRLPFRKFLMALAAATARARILPLALRGRAFKAWRALVYAGAL